VLCRSSSRPSRLAPAANAALALVPGGVGTAFDPIVDAFINQVIAAILAKKPTTTTQG
jgi:large-conductance mechanosensitive channel